MVKKVEKKSATDRQQKWECRNITYISGTLQHFKKQLDEDFKRTVPEEFWDTARLELDKEYDYGDSVTPVIQVSWYRPETDSEYEARRANEAIQQEYRRKQYEQLKKEFG